MKDDEDEKKQKTVKHTNCTQHTKKEKKQSVREKDAIRDSTEDITQYADNTEKLTFPS